MNDSINGADGVGVDAGVQTAVLPVADTSGDGHVDCLIVGAGLSGIGAACHLQREAPEVRYAILEARAASGGTWDLFRYPGVRSDSDMFTLGYAFRPWLGEQSIAPGGDILRYIRETATEYGVDRQIRYETRVLSADWSSAAARWTVAVEDVATGTRSTRSCSFLYLCSGYFRYDEGYTPPWPGTEHFAGTLVHPQYWPADLDVTGKRVVVIGSGATAVTLVPTLARSAASVMMLQRSPSYYMPLPERDAVADLLRRLLPPKAAYAAVRWKNVRTSSAFYALCQRWPTRMRALLRRVAVRSLPDGFDVATHFTPRYDPWDQRMCVVPGGDIFAAIRDDSVEIVTDQIDTFTATGLRLRSGKELDADVVVTATGLNLLPLGGIGLSLDGTPVVVSQRVAYKGMMLDGVPNMAFALGYTNASWTLKVDLVSSYVARLMALMRRGGYARVTPRLPAGPIDTTPFIEMTSGYFERSRDLLPLQGPDAPWRLRQVHRKDAALFAGSVDAPELEFGVAGARSDSAADSAAAPAVSAPVSA